mgnify:CR=1 FL=1
METIYDVMKDRLQVTEATVMVTVLSGPRQGDKTIYAEDGRVLYGTPIAVSYTHLTLPTTSRV